MKNPRKKRCRYCGCCFRPHPRLKSRQICCGAPGCRNKRKKETQKRWHEKNPSYFHNRYESSTQPWLKEHPGYLKAYRTNHPAYVEKNRKKQKKRDQKRKKENLDIQDSIMIQDLSYQRDTHKLSDLDIQDTIMPYPELFLGLMSYLRFLDIQDTIDISLHSIYNRGRFLLRRYADL